MVVAVTRWWCHWCHDDSFRQIDAARRWCQDYTLILMILMILITPMPASWWYINIYCHWYAIFSLRCLDSDIDIIAHYCAMPRLYTLYWYRAISLMTPADYCRATPMSAYFHWWWFDIDDIIIYWLADYYWWHFIDDIVDIQLMMTAGSGRDYDDDIYCWLMMIYIIVYFISCTFSATFHILLMQILIFTMPLIITPPLFTPITPADIDYYDDYYWHFDAIDSCRYSRWFDYLRHFITIWGHYHCATITIDAFDEAYCAIVAISDDYLFSDWFQPFISRHLIIAPIFHSDDAMMMPIFIDDTPLRYDDDAERYSLFHYYYWLLHWYRDDIYLFPSHYDIIRLLRDDAYAIGFAEGHDAMILLH